MSKARRGHSQSCGRFTPSKQSRGADFVRVLDDANTVAVLFDDEVDSFRHVPGSLSVPGVEDGGLLVLEQLPVPSAMYTVVSENGELCVEKMSGKASKGPPVVLFLNHAAFHQAMEGLPWRK